MRPIDADELLVGVKEHLLTNETYTEEQAYNKAIHNRAIESVIRNINAMPTIKGEPVLHSHWVPLNVSRERMWCCNRCKTLGSPQWKRCPVCEAKMDLEE